MPQYIDEQVVGDSFRPFGAVLRRAISRFEPGPLIEDEQIAAIEATPSTFRDAAKLAIERGLVRCESPIEKAILPWLVVQWYQFFNYNPAVLFPGEQDHYVPCTVAVVPQLPIGKYRTDFALAGSLGGPVRFVIIECDGKQFHDGFNNVVRDLSRDVAILKNQRVLRVVRINGSDILKDASAAAKVAARGVLDAWARPAPGSLR